MISIQIDIDRANKLSSSLHNISNNIMVLKAIVVFYILVLVTHSDCLMQRPGKRVASTENNFLYSKEGDIKRHFQKHTKGFKQTYSFGDMELDKIIDLILARRQLASRRKRVKQIIYFR